MARYYEWQKFPYIYSTSPIDYWYGAELASAEETQRVLSQMPEEPRYDDVFKVLFPTDTQLTPIYICKADNNGTTYIFSDFDIMSAISWWRVAR